MVRFVLKDLKRDFSITMEMPDDEKVSELQETVREYWGDRNVVFVRDYMLLDSNATFGEAVSEGDLIETFPDMSDIARMGEFLGNDRL